MHIPVHFQAMALGTILVGLSLSACGDADEQVGVALNWTITSATEGTVTCLEANAATVEWAFDSLASERETLTFSYDCVDSGQTEIIDSGEYQVSAKLKRGDAVVLSEWESDGTVDLSATANDVGQCEFEIP